MRPQDVRALLPTEVASILGWDVVEGIKVVPFDKEPFRPRPIPPGHTGDGQIIQIA